MNFDTRLNHIWWTLRLTFGLVPIVAGLDKYFNLLTNWEQYLNPAIPGMLHLSPLAFMHMVGIVEICAGVLVLTPITGYASYIVMLWLVGIAGNLLVQGRFLDIAVRDIVLAVAAYSLARLTQVRQDATQQVRVTKADIAMQRI
ncbi:MAG TPA: hypothetical protein VFU86_03375 [Terriglobales bacterium]|nr:hypothetical protein [Terriglobales bacterium]